MWRSVVRPVRVVLRGYERTMVRVAGCRGTPRRYYTEGAPAVEQTPQTKKTILPPTERVSHLVSAYCNLTIPELLFLERVVASGSMVLQAQIAAEQAKIAAASAPPPAEAPAAAPEKAAPAPEAAPPPQSAPSNTVGTVLDKSASVKLVSYPDGAKINVLKEIRKLKTGMSIVDSKKLVENLPQILVKSATPDEQKEWKAALESTGAVVDFV